MSVKASSISEGDFLKFNKTIFEVVDDPKGNMVKCVNYEKTGYREETIALDDPDVSKATRQERASIIDKKIEAQIDKIKGVAKEILRLKDVRKDFLSYKSDIDMVKDRLEGIISGKRKKLGRALTPDEEEKAVVEVMDEYFKDTTGLLSVA